MRSSETRSRIMGAEEMQWSTGQDPDENLPVNVVAALFLGPIALVVVTEGEADEGCECCYDEDEPESERQTGGK